MQQVATQFQEKICVLKEFSQLLPLLSLEQDNGVHVRVEGSQVVDDKDVDPWAQLEQTVQALEQTLAILRSFLEKEEALLEGWQTNMGMQLWTVAEAQKQRLQDLQQTILRKPVVSDAALSVAATTAYQQEEEQLAAAQTAKPAASTTTLFQLLDPISVEEMRSVPKYMISRLTVDKLNDAILQLNKIITEKYKILKAPVGKMNKPTRERYWAMKESENADTKSKTFVTDADIQATKAGTKFRLDPVGRTVIAILRHLGQLRESRGGGLTRYIVVK